MYSFHDNFSVFTWRHQNSNLQTIDSSEFLLPLGITEPKHLYLHNFFLSYGITTLYRDMASDESLFDLADYPRDHFLHGRKNHKVLGKLKGECQGIPFQEFVGLPP